MSSTTLQQLKELGESMGLQGNALVEFIKEQQSTEREEREKQLRKRKKDRKKRKKGRKRRKNVRRKQNRDSLNLIVRRLDWKST